MQFNTQFKISSAWGLKELKSAKVHFKGVKTYSTEA